jgi:hypothetical protein
MNSIPKYTIIIPTRNSLIYLTVLSKKFNQNSLKILVFFNFLLNYNHFGRVQKYN